MAEESKKITISFCDKVRNLFKNVSCTSTCCITEEKIIIKDDHHHKTHHHHGHKRKRSREKSPVKFDDINEKS